MLVLLNTIMNSAYVQVGDIMVTTVQYEMSINLAAKAKKLGFDLQTRNSSFILLPKSGIVSLLVTETTGRNFASADELAQFLNGWDAAISLLSKRAGLTHDEIKSRIEQQQVMDTLADKRRRSVRL